MMNNISIIELYLGPWASWGGKSKDKRWWMELGRSKTNNVRVEASARFGYGRIFRSKKTILKESLNEGHETGLSIP
jgi:hypothetical protein